MNTVAFMVEWVMMGYGLWPFRRCLYGPDLGHDPLHDDVHNS